MSIVKAKIIDRVITFTERPLLYSHAKNVDYIHVTFDDEWTGYTKTAVFYRNIENPYAVLMDDNTATIPPEVMETHGKIYMGVFGVKDDEVLNSEVVFYPVGVGALTEGAMPEVTPDLWQDIISRIEEIKETGANIGQYVETATEAAETATTKAQEAETSATNASTAATNAGKAQTAAETAQGKAETAQSKAEEAQSEAESAKADAAQAKTDAQTAKTDAETAKTQAESARDTAQGYANSANSAKTQAETAKTQAVNAKNEAVEAANNAAADVEDNVSILETVTGETVMVEDSANDVIYDLKLYGKSVQQTEPGKNLCSKSEYTVQGDNTNRALNIEEIPAGTYTISMNCPAHETITETDILIEKDNTELTEWLQLTTGQRSSVTFTISQPANRVLFSGASGTYTEIQIEAGETATAYEPYKEWSTPSPENPVPIESVESPTVTLTGKNLIESYEGMQQLNGATYTVDGSTIKVTGQMAYAMVFNRIDAKPLRGKYLALAGKGEATNQLDWRTINSTGGVGYPKISKPLLVDDDIKFIDVRMMVNNYNVELEQPKTVTFSNVGLYLANATGTADKSFEPPTEWQELATALNLHAVPVESGGNYVDEEGQRWIADVADFSTGKVTRYCGCEKITGKTANFKETSNIHNRFYWRVVGYSNSYRTAANVSILSFAKYVPWASGVGGAIDNAGLYFKPETEMTEEEVNALFQTMIDNETLEVVGQLVTPTTEDIPAEVMQAYKTLHTNEGTTNVFTDTTAGIELTYRNNRQLADNVVDVVQKKATAPVSSVNEKTGDVVLTIDDLNIEDVTEPMYETIYEIRDYRANINLTSRGINPAEWTSLDAWMGANAQEGQKRLGVWKVNTKNSLADMPEDAELDYNSLLHVYQTYSPHAFTMYLYADNGIYRRDISWMDGADVWDTASSEWIKISGGETLCLNTNMNTINVNWSTSLFIKQLEMHFPDEWNGKKALITIGPIFTQQDDTGTFGIKYRIANAEDIENANLVLLQNNTSTDMFCKRIVIDIPVDAQDYVFELGFTKSSGKTRVTGYSVTAISLN